MREIRNNEKNKQIDRLRKTLEERCGVHVNREGAIELILYNLNKNPELVVEVIVGQNCAIEKG